MSKKEDAKAEAKRCVSSARDNLNRAIKAIEVGEPISDVRHCFAKAREFIADSQEYLRELKKTERSGQ